MGDLWVFGYGSLMWNPGFAYDNAFLARIYGYHRSLCILSTYHRGTIEKPGLVMGLDKGGSCQGMAFHVPEKDADEAYRYLREREQPTAIYHEKKLKLFLSNGECVWGLAFVADRKHEQYAGSLSIEEIAMIVEQAHGLFGANIDYVLNTAQQLWKNNIHDPTLDRLAKMLGKTS